VCSSDLGMNLDNIEKFVDICAVVPYENAQSPHRIITYEALFNDKIKYVEYDQLVSESYVKILTKFDYHY
jgi:hypothetical protein